MTAALSSPVEALTGTRPAAARGAGRRPDIQGLRAVAVALVVLDHAAVPFLAGGFVGVDVFFVISGFLITGHLLAEVEAHGRIRFAEFYARRVRRILPAAVVVAVATVVGCLALVSPLRWAQIVEDGLASVLYIPNISFAVQGTDYLAGTAPSPFQHYWSLGVEEQFYLLWPAVIALAWVVVRRDRPRLGLVLGGLGLVSFLACLILVGISQPWAFFSLSSRAWELAAGGLVAVAAPLLSRMPDAVARVASWCGLAAILVSAVVVPASDWPGPWTLVPVLGAAAVIGCGRGEVRGAARVLGVRPLVALGGVSYALYLVHWPILVIAAEHAGLAHPLPLAITLALAVVSVPIAWLVFRFVETPALRGRLSGWRARPTLLVAGAATVTIAALLAGTLAVVQHPRLASDRAAAASPLVAGPSGEGYVPSNMKPTLAGAVADTGALSTDGCEQSQSRAQVVTCTFGPADATTTVALFGDSHAGRWFPALQAAAIADRFKLVTYVKSGCRSEELDANWAHSSNPSCDTWRADAVRRLNDDPPDVILLANHIGVHPGQPPARVEAEWTSGIRSSLGRLPAGSRIVTVADTPEFAADPRSCLATHLDSAADCSGERSVLLDPAVARAQRAVNAAVGETYLDLTDYFCNARTCPAIIGDTLVYSDQHHLTATFSTELGPVLAGRLVAVLATTH